MKKIATLLAISATFALPAVALAQGSGGDAYTEDIPGGGGNPPSNEGGNGDSPPGGTQSNIATEGDDNLAQSTGPGGTGSDGGGPGAGQADGSSTAPGSSDSDGSGSGFGEVVAELVPGSDDGVGLLLPIILGSVLVAAAAFVIARRRGRSTRSA